MKRVIIKANSSVSLDDIPDENKHGNCFQVAFNTFFRNPNKYKLVHGVVTGQGPLEGIQYCHAWVLDGDTVIDNTLSEDMSRLPKSLYYAIGDIRITSEYTLKDVQEYIDEYETYGPWESKFDKYP